MKETTLKTWKTALIVVLVILIGLLAMNQAIKFIGYSKAINDPCGTCEEVNPHLSPCFDEESNVLVDPVTGEIVENKNIYNISYDLYLD